MNKTIIDCVVIMKEKPKNTFMLRDLANYYGGAWDHSP
jgi:hypothetical protein